MPVRTANPQFLKNYYYNLNKNYGYNIFGSCSQIAIGMLLSYYDSYWNDNIIPYYYDRTGDISSLTTYWIPSSSAGIWSDYDLMPFPDNSSELQIDMNQYLDLIKNTTSYYHLHLLKKTMELGFFRTGDTNFGLNYYEIYDLIKNCLINIPHSIELCTNPKDVKNFVINKIKNNTPVLLRIGNSKGLGHAVIAYEYNENTDEIYFHSGLSDYGTRCTLESIGFCEYWDAISININTEHICGENHLYSGKSYCICELDGTHKNHLHNIFIDFFPLNYNEHSSKCICNFLKTDIHIIKIGDVYYDSNKRYGKCFDCKLLINLDEYNVKLIH